MQINLTNFNPAYDQTIKRWISFFVPLLMVLTLLQGLLMVMGQQTISPAPRIYIAPDRSFQLSVPVNYGLHTGKEKPSNSYIPVCHDSSIVCITYPPGRFEGTTFGDASFEVTLLDAKTESACLSPRALPISSAPGALTIPDFQIDTKHPSRVIDGTKFLHAVDFEGVMSHDIETNQYRGFKNGKCYNLAIYVTFTNFAVYEPGAIKEFTKHDIQLVTEDLMRVLDSFKTIESR